MAKMKKKKLELASLEVESFVTSLKVSEGETVQGGYGSGDYIGTREGCNPPDKPKNVRTEAVLCGGLIGAGFLSKEGLRGCPRNVVATVFGGAKYLAEDIALGVQLALSWDGKRGCNEKYFTEK